MPTLEMLLLANGEIPRHKSPLIFDTPMSSGGYFEGAGEQDLKLHGVGALGGTAAPSPGLDSQHLWAKHAAAASASHAFASSSISPDSIQHLSPQLELHPDDMVLSSPDSLSHAHAHTAVAATASSFTHTFSGGSSKSPVSLQVNTAAPSSSDALPSLSHDVTMDFDEHTLDLGSPNVYDHHFGALESPSNALSSAASMFALPESHGALALPQNFESTLSGGARLGSALSSAMTDTDISMSSLSPLSMEQPEGSFSFDARVHVIPHQSHSHGLSHASTSSHGLSHFPVMSQGSLSHVSTSSQNYHSQFSASSHQQTRSPLAPSSDTVLSSHHDYSFPSVPDPTLQAALSHHQHAVATNFSAASNALFPTTPGHLGVPPRPTVSRAQSGGAVGRLATDFDHVLSKTADVIKGSPDAPSPTHTPVMRSMARSSSLPLKTNYDAPVTSAHMALSRAATLPMSSSSAHSSPTMSAPPLVDIPSLVSYDSTGSPSADRDSQPPAEALHIPSIASPTDSGNGASGGRRRSCASGSSSSSRSRSREKRAPAGLSSDKKVTPSRGRKKRSCENCFFAKTACDGQRPCNRCTRLKKPSCKDRVPVKREQFKYAGGVGGQVVPFLPASHLAAFGLPSAAFAHLEREPMYPVTDIGVHLKAIKESIVRAYTRCAPMLREKPQMAISSISYDVENLSLPGSLTEIEMIKELKEIVGLPQETVIPRDLRKFERYRDSNAESSEFFPSVIRKDMNQRCGVIRYTTTKEDNGTMRVAYNCNNRLRTMYGLSKQVMDAMGFVFSPRFIHPDDWEEIVCDSLRSLDVHAQCAAEERETNLEDRLTSVRPIRMLNRSGRMAPVIALTYESSRSASEQSMMIVLVPVAT